VKAVRTSVGLFDASPLGKLLVEGPDAAEFLHRMYLNNIKSLKIGKCRYGVMLGEDGVVTDDGVCARLGEQRFLVGTTSGAVNRIADALEEWLQCEWVDLRVLTENVTTQWAVMTVTGPKARDVLAQLQLPIDLAAEAFPHMSVQELRYGDVPMRIMRVSFTGELSYEISVPFSFGRSLWQLLRQAGERFGITPIGVEAMMVLRTEKGYLHVGTDTDGTTVPQDIGMAAITQAKADDFVGRRSTLTPEARREGRRQLVGLRTADDRTVLPIGGHVVGVDFKQTPYLTHGWVTSSVMSDALKRPVALGLVADGRKRMGEAVLIYDGGRTIAARIVDACAYDPKGERINA
jgi:sarcosine oxidase subunit alpha